MEYNTFDTTGYEQIKRLDSYIIKLSEVIDQTLKSIYNEDHSVKFDVRELNTLDINYTLELQNMKQLLTNTSKLGNISLSSSLKQTLDFLNDSTERSNVGETYTIEPNQKKEINKKYIETTLKYSEILTDLKEKFEADISCSWMYKQSISLHLRNNEQKKLSTEKILLFNNELGKTKYLIETNSILYVGMINVLEQLSEINKILCRNNLWVSGSDFIQNLDLFLFKDNDLKTSFLSKEILKNSYLIEADLRETVDSKVLDYIKTGVVDETDLIDFGQIIEETYNKYTFYENI